MVLRLLFKQGLLEVGNPIPMHACLIAVSGPFEYLSPVVLLITIGSTLLGVVYLILPFIALNRLTALLDEAESQTKLLEVIAQNTSRGESSPAPGHCASEKHGEGWKKTLSGR